MRKARAAFRSYVTELPHEKRIDLEQNYTSQSFFDFKFQTAQVPFFQVDSY